MSASGKVGRPSIHSKAIADEIFLRMADGESLRRICKDAHMPARSVVYDWVKTNPEFRELYALARELQVEGLADDIIAISDDATKDRVERVGPNGEVEVVSNPTQIKRDRLRVNARKWTLARQMPRKYGRKEYLSLEPSLLPSSIAKDKAKEEAKAKAEADAAKQKALAEELARWEKGFRGER